MLRPSLWALESRKQRKHNVRTHCLTSAAAAPQRQTKALKNQSFSLKRKQTQTQRNTNTKKDARKTLEKRPHARSAPTSPSWGAPKPSGGEPTNRRLNGTGGGGAPHGAKRPHLRIIVYISNKRREDQPLNQYGWKLEQSLPTKHGEYSAYTGTPKQQFFYFHKENTRFWAYIHGGWGGGGSLAEWKLTP